MNHGGNREGAGRKVGWRKGFSEQRPRRQLVAHEDEWILIKKFAEIVKADKIKADNSQNKCSQTDKTS